MEKKIAFFISTSMFAILLASFFFLLKKNDTDDKKNQQARASTDKPKSAQSGIPFSELESSAGDGPSTKYSLSTERKQPPLSENLPFESALFFGKSLDSQKIQSFLFSKKFDTQIDLFVNQSATDSNASELSSLYKKMLEEQLKKNNIKVQIKKFVCGTSLCIGSLENGEDSEYSRWSDIFFNDLAISSYGFVNSTVPLGANQFEHRFVFSTDPATNSLTVPRK